MRPADDIPWEVDDIALGDTPDEIRIRLRCRGTLTYVWACRTEARATNADELFNRLNDQSWAAENALVDALFAADGSEQLHMIFASPAAQREDLRSFMVPEVHEFQLVNREAGGLWLASVPLDSDIQAELRSVAQRVRTPPPTPPTPEYSDDGDDGEDGTDESSWTTPRLIVADEDRTIFPRYLATDITVLKHDDMFSPGFIVPVDGRKAVAKLLDYHRGVQREYDRVRRISQSTYADTIQTTKVMGFVVDSEDGRELGILEEYVSGACQCCESLCEMGRFHEVAHAVKLLWSRTWISQLRETLDQLHEIGVIWGEGPASSLKISETKQVFIIDFGSSTVETIGHAGPISVPWTEMEKAFEGLMNFLTVEEDVERLGETWAVATAGAV